MNNRLYFALPIAIAAGALVLVDCSGGDSTSGKPPGTTAAGGTSGTTNSGSGAGSDGGSFGFDAGITDAELTEDSACAQQAAEATLVKKPVDVIITIDNSGSMGQEIKGVQDNINVNFAQILQLSGVDYRVIMVTEHGPLSPESVCIEAPLSGIPQGGCNSPPGAPVNNSPIFFHYDFHQVSSHDALCKLLDRYAVPDDHNFAPMGYQQWLRPEAFKAFLMVTDDGVSCTSSTGKGNFNDGDNASAGATVATNWDIALTTMDPVQFGTPDKRNYIVYSLVALVEKDANNKALPWLPTDPITTQECPTAADPGTGYQGLSNLTSGLKFPLCSPSFYDTMFNEIAKGVIEGAKLNCEFEIPEPPDNLEIDLESVIVEFTPSNGPPVQFEQVASENECADGKFYIDEQANLIKLCPETCKQVEGDDQGKIQVLFGCKGDVT